MSETMLLFMVVIICGYLAFAGYATFKLVLFIWDIYQSEKSDG